jgi:hypothetical protein
LGALTQMIAVVLVTVSIMLPLSGSPAGPILLQLGDVPAPPGVVTWQLFPQFGKIELFSSHKAIGLIDLPSNVVSVLAESPDGAAAILDDGEVLAWNGSVVGHLIYAGHITGVPVDGVPLAWPDDQHLCAILNASAEPLGTLPSTAFPANLPDRSRDAYLWTFSPNRPSQMIAALGNLGYPAPRITQCDWKAQQAVIDMPRNFGPGGMTTCQSDTVARINLATRQVQRSLAGCTK